MFLEHRFGAFGVESLSSFIYLPFFLLVFGVFCGPICIRIVYFFVFYLSSFLPVSIDGSIAGLVVYFI